MNTTPVGDRNNQLAKHAQFLLDNGEGLDEIRRQVLELNSSFIKSLPEPEIEATILAPIARKLT